MKLYFKRSLCTLTEAQAMVYLERAVRLAAECHEKYGFSDRRGVRTARVALHIAQRYPKINEVR